ncbi:hypothetical protein N7495_006554 [Penicillium taxi]|uniref:uncharacterized protein n=1 Tax=Penicillium taxi TaxID=168475 RepID=UPI002544D4AE|nr:uncharacterized protein N7495_006554 [Penicillium taxi]KAJ5894863.1 hypothetical protein N7495_006554 [Penicillium taxi]
MQPEPTPVSQRTPAVDLNRANVSSRQHGYDFEDRPVSVPPQRDEVRDLVGVDLPVPEMNASMSASRPTPPYYPAPFKLPIESLPNEVLTHILSHLPPDSLSAITLVSRRFHALVTTPHAWRIAFSRFFPGPQVLEDGRYARDEADVASDRRFFTRLTALASWRSEYIIRTRLMRSLSRGKPAQFQPSKKSGTVRSTSVRNGSAVTTYTSQLLFPVSHIHGSFNGSVSNFIHAASEQGVASASDPSTVKVGTWGLSDYQIFRHFADQFPGDSQYGLGPGEIVGVPNSMDVSQPFGMIYGEGCPSGRTYFISSTEQRGRFLGISDLGSLPHLGVPAVNMITQVICSVWIAKSPSILKTTGGLIAMMSGSSSGVLSAYAIGPHPTYEKRYERGQLTAKWVLCPGVPIIGISVDDNYNPKRRAQRRIWAVALNALGEIFYLTDLPRQPEISPTAKLNAEQMDELAWKTGRSVRWELNELSRRVAYPDPFNQELVDGSYSPRSSPDSMGLDVRQLTAETKEIEKFMSFKPKHFRKVCKSWNMRRDLHVDFAGDDGLGSGESIIVIARGDGETEEASVRRYVHALSKSGLAPSTMGEGAKQTSIFGGPVNIPTSASGGNPRLVQ